MVARVYVEVEAIDRLAAMGLDGELLQRVLQKADAEASTCTELDPPIMAGLMRWGRANRYLREELIPSGWGHDNPRNLPRTINPGGDVAVVATSGDEQTGMADGQPTTKYAKGIATAVAVGNNNQLAFDFGDLDLFSSVEDVPMPAMRTWFLLYFVAPDRIQAELSLPGAMNDGVITHWTERIVLPFMSRDPEAVAVPGTPPGGDDFGDDSIVVEVSRR
jgi:hypothetical protein